MSLHRVSLKGCSGPSSPERERKASVFVETPAVARSLPLCLTVSLCLPRLCVSQALTEPSFPDGFVLSFPMRTNYMYGLVRKEITEMYAFTACLWLKAKEGGIGTPFSYSVPGQPNELVLLQGVHNPVELLINDKVDKNIFFFISFPITWGLKDQVKLIIKKKIV